MGLRLLATQEGVLANRGQVLKREREREVSSSLYGGVEGRGCRKNKIPQRGGVTVRELFDISTFAEPSPSNKLCASPIPVLQDNEL